MIIKDMIADAHKRYTLQQVGQEWQEFIEYVEKLKPRTTLEIGMASGASSLCLSNVTETLITLDCATPRNQDVFKELSKNCHYHHIVDNSHNERARKKLKELLKVKKLDLLFIDGDHSYQGVKDDFKDYLPFMEQDGVIAFHDITKSHYSANKLQCHVYKLWDEINIDKTKYKSLKSIAYNAKWGGIGIVEL